VLIVKVTRIKPGQLEPEAVVATTDQEVARKVIRLIREALTREEEQDGLASKLPVRNQTDD
jgi:hypothetical protein